MTENGKESSMEEILSSIKRIIAEDKAVEIDRPALQTKSSSKRKKPTLDLTAQDESNVDEDASTDNAEEILELTNEVKISDESSETASSARGVFGDRRKKERLINDQKLDSMRQSLSALVAMENANSPAPVKQTNGTSLEDITRDLMRPMLKAWLNEHLPQLVEELVAEEIRRISQK